MTTLDQVPLVDTAVHLLAVGDSKMGKSVYTAEAAISGLNIAYFDCDNGVTALQYALKDQVEAQKRLHYYPIGRPSIFLSNLLRSSTAAPFRWVPRLNQLWNKLATDVRADDDVWYFNIQKLPKTWLLAIDSWTPVAADALGIGDATQSAVLLEGTDQSIYGDANARLTYICNLIQKLPMHVIVHAHATVYERYEKPLNVVGRAIQQREMKLVEILDVPVSSSRPHGQTMATRFNHIGWMTVDGMGETTIDFTRKQGRIGGGPPNKISKTRDLPFVKLLSQMPLAEDAPGWYAKTTHGELLEAIARMPAQVGNLLKK